MDRDLAYDLFSGDFPKKVERIKALIQQMNDNSMDSESIFSVIGICYARL